MPKGARIRRRRDGTYDIKLSAEERNLLAGLPTQIIQLVNDRDPSTERLFPPAYTSDAEAEADYRNLMGDTLADHHKDALGILAMTANQSPLDQEQMDAWLTALNDMRLVLGTRLGVTEELGDVDPDDLSAPAMALYQWLTWLQDQVIDAVSSALGAS